MSPIHPLEDKRKRGVTVIDKIFYGCERTVSNTSINANVYLCSQRQAVTEKIPQTRYGLHVWLDRLRRLMMRQRKDFDMG
jgi:hypothetical protein